MDPRDESLLQDLLDDRLDDAAAAGVRERLAAESELREIWDDLLRIRELVGGPAGETERAPEDFLSRVRARIAVASTAGEGDAAGDRPRLRLLPGGRRFSVAWVAVAALLFVAVGVRLFLVDDTPATEEDATIISATAPEAVADELRERDGSGVPDVRESLARTDEAGPPPTPAPAPPAAPRSARPGRFMGPGDRVPPGIREPSDVKQPSAFGGARGGSRRLRGHAKEKARGDVGLTLEVEAAALEEGHARIALLVASLESLAASPAESGERLAVHDRDEKSPEILGSVILELPRAKVRALERLDPEPADATPASAKHGDNEDKRETEADLVRVRILVVRTR